MALITKSASCTVMLNWYKANNAYHSYSETPKRGDVVFYDWSGLHKACDHVGIVVGVNADGTITAIEGNTSVTSDDNGGAVMRRTRYKSQIIGYGRPHYSSAAELEKYIDLAEQQIGTKENPYGSNKVKYNTWYYGSAVSGSAYPWCAAFISWLFLSGDAPASEATCTVTLKVLKKGSQGAQVKALQRMLNSRYGGVAVDGDFGSGTLAAVKKAQKELQIEQDGVVGVNTWTGLLKNMG